MNTLKRKSRWKGGEIKDTGAENSPEWKKDRLRSLPGSNGIRFKQNPKAAIPREILHICQDERQISLGRCDHQTMNSLLTSKITSRQIAERTKRKMPREKQPSA